MHVFLDILDVFDFIETKMNLYLWLLLSILWLSPLQSASFWWVDDADDEELQSLLLVDVVTIELVEDDNDDMEFTVDGGGNVLGLTGYLCTSITWNINVTLNGSLNIEAEPNEAVYW